MGQNDRFANIAAAGMATANKGLVEPHIRKSTEAALPLNGSVIDRKIFCSDKTVEQEVQEEMQALREHYMPFMQNFAPQAANTRKQIPLSTFQWRVATAEDKRHFQAVLEGAGTWELVNIPHYGGPLGKVETIYRTTFEQKEMPRMDEAVFLHFNGVDYKAKVFLNGCFLGMHEGMFAPFEYECTESIIEGTNTVVVCVENDYVQMGSRDEQSTEEHTGDKIYAATGPGYDDAEIGWHHCPPGMGIYQEVYLETRPRRFLSDLYVRPMLKESQAEICMEAYQCDVGKNKVFFRISIYGHNFSETVLQDFEYIPETGRFVGLGDTFTQTRLIEQGLLDKPVPLYLEKGINYFQVSLPIQGFRTWEPEQPWLYEVQVQLLDENRIVLDSKAGTFGMRSFEMDTESDKKGMMYLNGKKIRLRGANTMGFEQQDVMQGDFEQLVEDILLAKACNMNFLRITQRPVQDVFYQYCDMLGMLIQTDLPMFGVLRRNQFAEAVRQVGEMERLVRSHPCVILDTYINEPFPNANNAPHRNLTRQQLMDFFDVADKMIHLENPDRVVKHVDGDYDPPSTTLPDNHVYTCWYNGHGLDAGALHKGDWIPVKEGWYYGCGEFGAEGLENMSVMRKYYPKAWLPQSEEEEESWSPNQIVRAQSGNFHYFFYETPHSLAEWVEKSQEYQAEAIKWMTEAFRRNADMVTFAIHLFIDAFPAGWMKTIVDVDRNLKPAYYVYRDALTPTMVSLRTDRFTYFTGETAIVEVWLCNDRSEDILEATVVYEAELPDGSLVSGSILCDIAGSDVTYAGELQIPVSDTEGTVHVRCAILDKQGNVQHRNILDIRVYACRKKQEQNHRNLLALNSEGKAAQLIRELQEQAVESRLTAECILIDNYQDYANNREELEQWIKEGHKLIFLELPAGDYEICGREIKVLQSSMMPLHFVSRDTGHPWVQGFDAKAFRHWYEQAEDRITPILESTFVQEEMRPVLISGNTDEQGNWGKVLAVGEMAYGKGCVVVCQLKLAGRVQQNPVTWMFADRMLSEPDECQ